MSDHHHGQNPCRVCGFQNSRPAGAQAYKCECCGVLIGLEDQSAANIALWRAKFISNGGRWQTKPSAVEQQPAND